MPYATESVWQTFKTEVATLSGNAVSRHAVCWGKSTERKSCVKTVHWSSFLQRQPFTKKKVYSRKSISNAVEWCLTGSCIDLGPSQSHFIEKLLRSEMGAVRITSWYPKFNGSLLGLPPSSSSIHKWLTGWQNGVKDNVCTGPIYLSSLAWHGTTGAFILVPHRCEAFRLGINSCVQLATDPVLHWWDSTGRNTVRLSEITS